MRSNDGLNHELAHFMAVSSAHKEFLGAPTTLSSLSTSTKKMKAKKKMERKNKQKARRK